MLITILAFVVVLSILVLIHELGHFLVAKKLGIKVEEFGFGFPPRLFGVKRGETLYSINLLPVGGFVKLYGEDAAGGGSIQVASSKYQVSSMKKKIHDTNYKIPNTEGDLKRAFFARPIWQRFSVVVAGVVMNFLLAVVIISYLFGSQGVALPTEHVRITEVVPNSPAASAGIKEGDEIISVNGIVIRNTEGFISEIQKNLGSEVALIVETNGVEKSLQLTPRKDVAENEGPVGVGITSIEIKKYPWWQAPFFGTLEALRFTGMIFDGIGKMVFGLIIEREKPEGIAGPVGIAQLAGQAVSYGIPATLWLTALLSLNLAVLNILPIPALDGGRLFFIIIELVTRRKVNPKYEGYAHAAGIAVLLSLMLLITVFDLLRIFSGESLIPK